MTGTVSYVAQGTKLYVLNVTSSPSVISAIAQLDGLSNIGGMASAIKLSNFDSPGYDEFNKGLVDPVKPSGTIFLNMADASHQYLHSQLKIGQNSTLQFFYGLADSLALPTITGTIAAGTIALVAPQTATSPHTWTRSGFLFSGFVAEFSISNTTNNVAKAKLTIQATGAIGMVTLGQAITIIN